MKMKMINYAGLYTQEQWDKLQMRTKQLWAMLNSAHALLSTRPSSIKAMTEESPSLSEEDRMAMIRTDADKMAEMAGRCEAVMQDTNWFDVTQW